MIQQFTRRSPKKRSSRTKSPQTLPETDDVKTQFAAQPVCDRTSMSGEQRRQWIAETAYFLAQRRGFKPGHEVEDWLQAEAEVDLGLRGLAK